MVKKNSAFQTSVALPASVKKKEKTGICGSDLDACRKERSYIITYDISAFFFNSAMWNEFVCGHVLITYYKTLAGLFYVECCVDCVYQFIFFHVTTPRQRSRDLSVCVVKKKRESFGTL